MGSRELLEYLVLKQLCGRSEVIWIIYQYYVNDESISSIADRFGMKKTRVKNYIQRVKEKIGSLHKAKILLKYVVPEIFKLEPITIKTDTNFYRCKYCVVEIHKSLIEDHIKRNHADKIDEAVEHILSNVRVRVNSRNG